MKHKVIKNFKCKESGEYFSSGSFYVSTDYNRVQLLKKLEFIIPDAEVESLKIEKKQPSVKRGKKKVVDEDATEN